MKKLFSLFVFGILLSGCQKKAASPAPPTTTSTASTTTLTPLETAMVGDWITDSIVTYNNGTAILHTPYTDPVNCHFLVTATCYSPTVSTDWKISTNNANGGGSGGGQWRISSGKMETNSGSPGGINTIVSYSASQLVLQYGSTTPTGGSAMIYYFHK